ncbi:MAG: 5-(carboxyamino)imidazole ribonucleotide synthase [Rhodospirillales bacterium]|nr:5-(carboxyamino)imidazole ribonucleotide synthase [Rhodospirillales bacterium]
MNAPAVIPAIVPAIVPPGGTIGIIGGGQLGRMTALAAAAMGYRCHIFCPEPDSPAFAVAAEHTIAEYTDREALGRFADAVDVVTFEFENIPHESVQILADHVVVRPSWECLHISQDRLIEKDFLNGIGIATTAYRRIEGPDMLRQAIAEIGPRAVLKTVRMGYDGKGQVMMKEGMEADDAWARMGGPLGILEAFVDYEREISVVIARGPDGKSVAFEPVENRHANHILDVTIAPANIPAEMAERAVTMATRTVEAMDLIGLLAVEMFVGRDGTLLVNELAPRPHNSGHWSMDACVTGQFEQFVRAVCGLPLGSPERHSDAVMKNLLGHDVDGWAEYLTHPNAKLHLYGKKEARPGRKMGHVNTLYPKGSGPRG